MLQCVDKGVQEVTYIGTCRNLAMIAKQPCWRAILKVSLLALWKTTKLALVTGFRTEVLPWRRESLQPLLGYRLPTPTYDFHSYIATLASASLTVIPLAVVVNMKGLCLWSTRNRVPCLLGWLNAPKSSFRSCLGRMSLRRTSFCGLTSHPWT